MLVTLTFLSIIYLYYAKCSLGVYNGAYAHLPHLPKPISSHFVLSVPSFHQALSEQLTFYFQYIHAFKIFRRRLLRWTPSYHPRNPSTVKIHPSNECRSHPGRCSSPRFPSHVFLQSRHGPHPRNRTWLRTERGTHRF